MTIRLAHPYVGDEEIDAVTAVLRSGQLSQSSVTEQFEQDFSKIVGGRACIGVNSGTSALHIGLLAAGIGPGDEVILPSFTFAATANAVALTGAKPIFVDIEPDTYCMSPQATEAAITPRTVALLPVHLYGHMADVVALRALADRHGVLLIEDAAQAHAAAKDGTPAGGWGELAMFSFYPTKNMTTGEGGMVVTGDPEIERRCRLLRNQGMEARYQNEVVGLNVRMTDLAAAIGRPQLERLGAWTYRRQEIAAEYDRELRNVTVPTVRPGVTHVYHQYTIRTDRRDELLDRLHRADIGADVYYPTPVHRLPSFDLDLDLPATSAASRQVLSIPVHPHLSDAEVSRVIEVINQ